MVFRGERQLLKLAMMVGIAPSVLHASDDINDKNLRRKRVELPGDPMRKGKVGGSHVNMAMADFWEEASQAAAIELETARLLQTSPDFSMPTQPTRPPVPRPTSAPNPSPIGDCLGGGTREEYIFDLLVQVTPAALLNDPSTPQGKAFDFLANDDPHLSDPCSSSTIEQRYGLVTLYYATNGDRWVSKDGWLGGNQECQWEGVSCTEAPGIVSRLLLCK